MFASPIPLPEADERQMASVDDAELFNNSLLKGLHEKLIIEREIRHAHQLLGTERFTVLDVGCGTGWTSSVWARHGAEVTGLEPSASRARIARERHGFTVIESFVEGLATDLLFDVVIIRHVLEHLEHPLQVITSLRAHLKENGLLLVIVPNIYCIGTLLFREHWTWVLPYHCHFFTPPLPEGALDPCRPDRREELPDAVPALVSGEFSPVCRPGGEDRGNVPEAEHRHAPAICPAGRSGSTDRQERQHHHVCPEITFCGERMHSKVLILGAGPTGLGAAYHLKKLVHTDWRVFERNPHVGGLSASFVDDNGFTWDIGGHVLFSHYDYFDRAVEGALGGDYYSHLRECRIRIMDGWVPYPFQNNIRHLPPEALEHCLEGLRVARSNPADARNFRQWMDAVFGEGIVRYFMEPYNRKVWGVPLETMGREWLGERVSVVDLERIEKNIAEQRDDVSWGPNNRFKFPKRGGTGAIFGGIARPLRDRISYDHELMAVDMEAKVVSFANGRKEQYDVLISTIPLDCFIQKCVAAPEVVRDAARSLVHNGGLIVGLGFAGKRRDSTCWMYFPEANSPFYRVTNFFNYSPHNVPSGDTDNYFSLMCETTYSSHKPVDKETIIDETIQGLVNSGMITEEDRGRIVSRYLMDIPYSYPVPTLGRDRALAVIQPFLESKGVYSRGRFGAWKYEVGNMDHSFMQGVEVVDRVLGNGNEPTLKGSSRG
jgi:protoporphyrinogen oxidase/SAM-dependent methyltransferase